MWSLFAKPTFTLSVNSSSLDQNGVIGVSGTIQPYWEDMLFQITSNDGQNVSLGGLSPATPSSSNLSGAPTSYSDEINLSSYDVNFSDGQVFTLDATAMVHAIASYDDLPNSSYAIVSTVENVTFSAPTTQNNCTSTTDTNGSQAGCHLPIIIIPGLGGTSDYSDPSFYNQIWPCLGGDCHSALLFSEPSDYTSLILDPTGGSSSATIGDILESGICGSSSGICDTYSSLVGFLENQMNYKEGYDLYVFPYDWRLDMGAYFSNLTSLIHVALNNTGSQKVIFIADGSGGVLARAYLIENPTASPEVYSVISLGTPYWGMPQMFNALINGYSIGNPTQDQDAMKILEQNMPSLYELACQYSCVYDNTSGSPIGLNFSQLSEGIRYASL